MAELGHWKKPKTLAEAKQITDTIIDNMDPEWLSVSGCDRWAYRRRPNGCSTTGSEERPPIREYVPYFIFMLSINIFFYLVLPSELLRSVKPSHQVDLAYLYYLPFCTVFTSKDRFHEQIVPLFLDPFQTFVNGEDLKAEIKKLGDHYSRFPESELEGINRLCPISSRGNGIPHDPAMGQISAALAKRSATLTMKILTTTKRPSTWLTVMTTRPQVFTRMMSMT